MKIAVDDSVCTLNAECTYAAPDVFRIVDGELVYDAEPTPEQEAAVREAVDACPTPRDRAGRGMTARPSRSPGSGLRPARARVVRQLPPRVHRAPRPLPGRPQRRLERLLGAPALRGRPRRRGRPGAVHDDRAERRAEARLHRPAARRSISTRPSTRPTGARSTPTSPRRRWRRSSPRCGGSSPTCSTRSSPPGGGDFCAEFTHRLPGYVFAEFFNLTPELGMAIREATREFVDAVQRFEAEDVKRTSLALYDIARTIIEMRQDEPLDPADDPDDRPARGAGRRRAAARGDAARHDPPVHRRRDGRPVRLHRQHGRPPRRAPRAAGAAARRSEPGPGRRRGVPAPAHAVPRLRPHADPGRRDRRPADPQGRAGRARLRLGQPRRVRLPRARASSC